MQTNELVKGLSLGLLKMQSDTVPVVPKLAVIPAEPDYISCFLSSSLSLFLLPGVSLSHGVIGRWDSPDRQVPTLLHVNRVFGEQTGK